MAANINGSLRVAGQVLNLKPENLAADPTGGGLVESRIWYNTVTKAIKFYNGTAVASVGDVTTAALTAALAPYAQTTDVNTAISNAVTDLVSGTEMQAAIDNALAGLDFQADVLGVEADYTNVAGRYIYTDGSKFTSGAAAAAGDIVVVNGAGVIQSVAYDVSAAGPGALTWNRQAVQWFRYDGTSWDLFGGLTGFTAGNGLQDASGTVSVKAANASIVVDGTGVKVGDLSATYVTPAALTTALADYVTDTDLTAVTGVINDLQAQVGASFFSFDSGATSATTHTITHNLNYRWPIVQLIDPATNQLITGVESIEFTSVNELVVTLGTAATLRASISWLKTGA
jgi:hypothetical protein